MPQGAQQQTSASRAELVQHQARRCLTGDRAFASTESAQRDAARCSTVDRSAAPAGHASSNALLRQAAEQNARAQHRASTTGSPPSCSHKKTAGYIQGLSLTELNYAIKEMEDQMEELSYNRRYSENVAGLGAGYCVNQECATSRHKVLNSRQAYGVG
ncbi:uncharacterized protein BDZ99DRAFT_525792 [Mytilinidion resinicola]|uniref:Uncharacterized protein n=1 Tax=Mytilinidion resinicola TaxID=574789 RepID=A0A6A6Y5T2_9PEZI|nr:uncharacterized protein BDZ99DRAFT_525792 [Mytilinidion resinicola]KAF2804201.1 hypothetical protein BDZ99DRAFT_525792 [Mytilinidion resinicola]